MSESEHGEFEAQLTLKDRMNFPYLFANQILTFQKALLAEEYSEREIQEAIKGFVNMIPSTWEDDKFKQDLETASRKVEVDVRPVVVPGIRLNPEVCEELGLPTVEVEEEIDYYKMFRACIDLLDRRGLTSHKTYTEKLILDVEE